MIYGKKLSLVVPVKNEAGIIAGFIRRVPNYVDEIIIVDNNSTDNTAHIAQKEGAIVLEEKRSIHGIGYGYAHQTGMRKATGDYIIAMDGDDTYPVKKIRPIIYFMENRGVDFVSCNRLPLRTPEAISWIRRLGIRVLNAQVQLLFMTPIQDILTGMWIVKSPLRDTLEVTSGDWNFSPEIKLKAITTHGIRFSEYYINHFKREKEISKQHIWKTGMDHMLFILVFWIRWIFRIMCFIGKETYAKE